MSGDHLWAPWRAGFVLGKKETGCVFCKRLAMPDTIKNLILYRGERVFVILNKFPYNSGHTLIVPNRHVGQLERLSRFEADELMALTQAAVAVIKRVMKPNSMNLGMNLGRGAGAGVPGHLHMHIVPRWRGDTNFMPVIGETKVISVPLEPVYEQLRREFKRL